MCLSIGGHVDSPGFEEIREDLMRFLLQKTSRDTEMELSDGEIADVDIVGVLKRSHPTIDEDSIANNHSAKLPRDLKKVRSKLIDSGASIEEISRVVVKKTMNHPISVRIRIYLREIKILLATQVQ
ncbi:hypothetical protein ALC53_01400 [Atta colombica]|uniref:Uncharacterized protein n=1 Tax=Atta colombica TaxID=520822 RepID=A0A195BU15_9HYME|nr:hypothetical protein ALC53_01400 [Atta colombica]